MRAGSSRPRRPRSSKQRGEVGDDSTSEQIQVVATFEETDHAAACMLLCDSQHVLRHFREVGIFEQEIAQRIVSMGVETRRNNDEVRMESAFDVVQSIAESLTICLRRGPAA